MQIVMPCLSLPKYVESLLATYYTVVLDWFSGQVYANLLKRDPQHLLVQLSKQINWVKLEDLCSGFHHDQGAGAPPTHSSAQLVRALLVGYLYNWPLRQLERQIRFNLIVKWFVGYSVYADGPDHCTLERFEVWRLNTSTAPSSTRCWARLTSPCQRNTSPRNNSRSATRMRRKPTRPKSRWCI